MDEVQGRGPQVRYPYVRRFPVAARCHDLQDQLLFQECESVEVGSLISTKAEALVFKPSLLVRIGTASSSGGAVVVSTGDTSGAGDGSVVLEPISPTTGAADSEAITPCVEGMGSSEGAASVVVLGDCVGSTTGVSDSTPEGWVAKGWVSRGDVLFSAAFTGTMDMGTSGATGEGAGSGKDEA